MIDLETILSFIHHYGVLIFAAVIIILAYRIFRKKAKSNQGTTFFLLGECGSGKTSLLYYVKY